MTDFAVAGRLFRDAETPAGRRLAARVWLTDAIQAAEKNGGDVTPALHLLAALEGLDFGHVDEILRLPKGQKAGGKEKPPADIGLDAMSLAAIDRLCELGIGAEGAVRIVADELGVGWEALTSKRKHVKAERGRPEPHRKRYRTLIEYYEEERAKMASQTKDEILFGLIRVAKLLGKK